MKNLHYLGNKFCDKGTTQNVTQANTGVATRNDHGQVETILQRNIQSLTLPGGEGRGEGIYVRKPLEGGVASRGQRANVTPSRFIITFWVK